MSTGKARDNGTKNHSSRVNMPDKIQDSSLPHGEKNEGGGERVIKYIARCGICSRREAERLIKSGRVMVNGSTIEACSTIMHKGDRVQVDNAVLRGPPEIKLWMYNKPVGLITTHHDPQKRPTVFANLGLPERVISVGRLDIQTSGLLLITNNGSIARALELPSSQVLREYKVVVEGNVPSILCSKSCIIDNYGISYNIDSINILGSTGLGTAMIIGIREGKNREVRNIMQCMGLRIISLTRIAYGPFKLASLAVGSIQEITDQISKISYILDAGT